MICCRCKRPIFRTDAATVVTQGHKPFAFGPKCAALAGLIECKKRKRKGPGIARGGRKSLKQIDLFEIITEGIL